MAGAASWGFAGVYAYKRYDLTHGRHLETLMALLARRSATTDGASAGTESVAAADASEQLL